MSPAQMFMQECRLTILVNWRREVRGELGYYPSCSLPMRMGWAGAEKTDCFAALVISAETYSGMFFICAEAAARASSSHIELWSGSLLEGLRRQWPKTARADSPRHFTTSFSLLCPLPPPLFFLQQRGSLVPRYSHTIGAKGIAKQGLVFHYC